MTRPSRLDLTGAAFGSWQVLSFAKKNERGEVYWHCVCSCGKERPVKAGSLTSGKSTSCGCNHKKAVTKHGLYGTPSFKSWDSMKQRCLNPKASDYHRYGGLGITVCERWKDSFQNFIDDMGERPKGCTLDRINNSEGYSPDNCRWASLKEQQRNRRNTVKLSYNGVEKPLIDWAEEFGLTSKVVTWRLNNGWSVKDALNTPKRLKRKCA